MKKNYDVPDRNAGPECADISDDSISTTVNVLQGTGKEVDVFDKEEIYREKIKPLVKTLCRTCVCYGIPMFVSCCTADNGSETTYVSDGVSPENAGVRLSNDDFPKMLAVLLGFDVIPPVKKAPDGIDDSVNGEVYFEDNGETEERE